jgi:ubiquinone/menaquinone biosynthesis C-methylase UbiE
MMPGAGEPAGVAGVPGAIWERGGVTIHLGGITATRRLLARCPIRPGQRVLELGCGTGYTAVLLARQHQARVSGIDITRRNLAEAQARAGKSGALIDLIQGDAHHLPFPAEHFDGVIGESVMLFCRASRVLDECHRVLRAGGWLALNEMVQRGPSPPELLTLLGRIGLEPAYDIAEWQVLLVAAGFVMEGTAVYPLSLTEQAASHLRVDGLRRYLSAAAGSWRDAGVRDAFMNRDALHAARHFRDLISYGLFVGRKPGLSDN